jgi:very-short-patch-repair endonuclease
MEMLPYNRKLKFRSRNLRNESTLCESLLWNKLKNRAIGFEFLRQKPIDNYILDFYCKELNLAVEIDGLIHEKQVEEDKFRQGQLEALGITFLRFSNNQIKNDLYNVVRRIKRTAKSLTTDR